MSTDTFTRILYALVNTYGDEEGVKIFKELKRQFNSKTQ